MRIVDFVLLDGSRHVGSLASDGVFTRRAGADLPGEWPLSVRVFIIWLSLVLRMRDNLA